MKNRHDIMSIEDFNSLPKGTELHYKFGGYGWWISDEECGPRGGRNINGSLMRWLHKLGVGMANPQSVASHQVRFFVETRYVDVDALCDTVTRLEVEWERNNIRRAFELQSVFDDDPTFRLTDYSFPQRFWSRGQGSRDKAFCLEGFRWVYGRALCLKDMPENLERLRLCLAGRDLAAESRARMVTVE